jgi:hypothetical protein
MRCNASLLSNHFPLSGSIRHFGRLLFRSCQTRDLEEIKWILRKNSIYRCIKHVETKLPSLNEPNKKFGEISVTNILPQIDDSRVQAWQRCKIPAIIDIWANCYVTQIGRPMWTSDSISFSSNGDVSMISSSWYSPFCWKFTLTRLSTLRTGKPSKSGGSGGMWQTKRSTEMRRRQEKTVEWREKNS